MIADLFCGAGGWGLACQRLGLEHHGYDIDPLAVATYTAAGMAATRADLSSYPVQHPDGVLASPPCQPYSQAGKRQGRTDSRGMLAMLVPPWCESARWVAMEQVPGSSSIFTRVAAHLLHMGFKVAKYELHTECYGVPQTRVRLILMAHRDAKPGKPAPTHSRYYPHRPHHLDPGLPRWVTMADALGWDGTVGFPRKADTLGAAIDGYRKRDLFGTSRPSPSVTGKARSWSLGDRYNTKGTVRDGHTPAPTLTASMDNGNFRWARERPATTVVGSFRPDILAAPGWRTTTPRQDQQGSVPIEVWQAGVLQGFPPDWPWQGSRTACYTQVGNAIPPPLAHAVIATLEAMC